MSYGRQSRFLCQSDWEDIMGLTQEGRLAMILVITDP